MISTQESLKAIVFLLLVFLLTSCDFSYNDSYQSIKYFRISKEDTISIKYIKKRFDTNYKIEEASKMNLYHTLKDSVVWYQIDLSSRQTEDLFITFREHFTERGEAFLCRDNNCKELDGFQYAKNQYFKNVFYKSPTWFIEKDSLSDTNGASFFFLKVTTPKWRNRVEFFVQNKNEFLKRIEIEYLSVGLYISFMLCLILVLVVFAVIKKEYSVVFYALYIFTIIVEFNSLKGTAQQFIWGDSMIFMSVHSFLYLAMGITQCFFMGYFYKFTKKSLIYRKITLICGWGGLPIIGLSVLNYYYPFIDNFYTIVSFMLKALALFFTVIHIVLLLEKSLPLYVAVFFLLSTFSHFIYYQINLPVAVPLEINYTAYNLRQLLVALEMICITRFIFDSVIKSQRQNHALKQINKDLKSGFQLNLIDARTKERNQLLGSVHDSFGGYLEALKIRLSMNPSPEKLQEIIDSFYKEYRILLNNIYSPEVDNENFKQYLIKYLVKIEALDILKIDYHVDLGSYKLSRETCTHLYRIISESFTNILKHAKATEAVLHFKVNDNNELELIISDNGIGFKEEVLKNRISYGLKSIEERVEKIGGLLKINSDSKQGTTLKVVLNKGLLG